MSGKIPVKARKPKTISHLKDNVKDSPPLDDDHQPQPPPEKKSKKKSTTSNTSAATAVAEQIEDPNWMFHTESQILLEEDEPLSEEAETQLKVRAEELLRLSRPDDEMNSFLDQPPQLSLSLIIDRTVSSRVRQTTDYSEVCDMAFQASTLFLDGLGVRNIDHLECFTEVSTIHLQRNNIEYIEGLEYCNKLKYLNLSRNKLTSADNIKELFQLEFLDLSHNCIVDLNERAFPPALRFLRIHHNPCWEVYSAQRAALRHRLVAVLPFLEALNDELVTVAERRAAGWRLASDTPEYVLPSAFTPLPADNERIIDPSQDKFASLRPRTTEVAFLLREADAKASEEHASLVRQKILSPSAPQPTSTAYISAENLAELTPELGYLSTPRKSFEDLPLPDYDAYFARSVNQLAEGLKRLQTAKAAMLERSRERVEMHDLEMAGLRAAFDDLKRARAEVLAMLPEHVTEPNATVTSSAASKAQLRTLTAAANLGLAGKSVQVLLPKKPGLEVDSSTDDTSDDEREDDPSCQRT